MSDCATRRKLRPRRFQTADRAAGEGSVGLPRHLGLIQYFRDFYAENQTNPAMHQLVMTLGKSHGKHFHDRKEYEAFLYRLFPKGPVLELCKLAGLPKPTEALAG